MTEKKIFVAKPQKNIDFEKLLTEIISRLSKTLEYLAKH